ncbi:MAG: hypothetical protein U0838_06605 [Chloroflexota bacterium]
MISATNRYIDTTPSATGMGRYVEASGTSAAVSPSFANGSSTALTTCTTLNTMASREMRRCISG